MSSHIQRSALLPFSAQQMYQLINDIEAYPQYLDGCVGAEMISQSAEHMEARLDLAKAGLKYSFTTRNRLTPCESIVMELVDGPFNHFQGEWRITALNDEASKINLDLAFELKGKVLTLAAKKLFEPVANNLVDAVAKRAKQLYGN